MLRLSQWRHIQGRTCPRSLWSESCSLDDQQQKPSEVSEQYFANHSRNLPYLYGGGCHLDGLNYFEDVASVLADAKKYEEKGE